VRLRRLVARTILLLTPFLAPAQEAHPTEAQVKAAYLFHFGKFVRWPADRPGARTSFAICVLGKDPFAGVLEETVAGENIGGRAITVAKVTRIQDAASCDVLFISSSEENRLASILPLARQMGVLTVGDLPHFAERGGVIGLVTQEGRVRFEANREAAEESRLVLSSELLKVATRVVGGPARDQK
jgi:hypothetical protein